MDPKPEPPHDCPSCGIPIKRYGNDWACHRCGDCFPTPSRDGITGQDGAKPIADLGVSRKSVKPDAQLAAWKADPARSGRTCRRGLWSWSRHPNYFGEFLVWCSFALLATATPGGAVAWYAPLVMLLLLLFVTGIPPAEAQARRAGARRERKNRARPYGKR